jgi:hypothetical protein
MVLLLGVVLMAAAAAVFVFSLPRGGRTARFVGTEWEGYAVVAMLCTLGVGVMLTITGVADLLN